VEPIRNYLRKESLRVRDEKLNDEEWVSIETQASVPRQANSWDCGVFVCAAVEHILAGKPLTYTQTDIPRLRNYIANTLISVGRSSDKKPAAS
jgi:sentrin-specific protease 1